MTNVEDVKTLLEEFIVIRPEQMKWVQAGLGVPEHEEVYLIRCGSESIMVYGKNRKTDKKMIDDMWNCKRCYDILSAKNPNPLTLQDHLNDHEMNIAK